MQYDAIIIGAGVAGLACAKVFEEQNLSYIILESGARPGGRVQTDVVDGYLLDHGFQVLQTGYPDIAQYLNLEELQLNKFPAGVSVRFNGRFHTIADPRQHPRHFMSTLTSPIGTLGDRFAMLKLTRNACRGSFAEIFNQPEELTLEFLSDYGFSQKFINSFFVPFLAGACLDKDIQISNRVLTYLIRVFAMGDATLPSKGMGEIPRQMAQSLSPDRIQFNSKAIHISDGVVTLDNGETIVGQQIVVATPEPALQDLLDIKPVKRSVGESCLYYSTDWIPPFKEPFLLLNGEGHGPVNNIAFPSIVASQYAPPDKTLIAVVVLDEQFMKRPDLENEVRKQCREWFGDSVNSWEHLRTYHIEHALPDQSLPTQNPYQLPEPISQNISICGEYQSLPGLQWAIMSGHMTGRQITIKS